jgi:hypothetical protein
MIIKSDRLVVEIADPDSDVYTRTRFDWTGFITQVTLDGKHTFCRLETEEPKQGTGGIGLCNEFGTSKPVGYDDAQVGEQFPKIGVGLLTRDSDEPYSPFYAYPLAPFSFEVHPDVSAITYITQPDPCRGYAALLKKRLNVQANKLSIEYVLTNVGGKPIDTHEYNHNFIGIDRAPLGPDYKLSFPFEVIMPDVAPPVQLSGRDITWTSIPQKSYCFWGTGYEGLKNPWWELVHLPSGVGMREQDDFEWRRLVLYGTKDLVSAEAFVDILVGPGQSQAWRRDYTFFDGR